MDYHPIRPHVEVLYGDADSISVFPREKRTRRRRQRGTVWLQVMKAVGFLAAVLLVVGGVHSLYPLKFGPGMVPVVILKLYMVFFGLTVGLIEGKNALPEHNQVRQWFYAEFHFLANLKGKAFYFILIGMLGAALTSENVLFLIGGGLIFILGVLYLVVANMDSQELRRNAGISAADLQTTTAIREQRRHHKGVPLQRPALPVAYVGDPPHDISHAHRINPHLAVDPQRPMASTHQFTPRQQPYHPMVQPMEIIPGGSWDPPVQAFVANSPGLEGAREAARLTNAAKRGVRLEDLFQTAIEPG